ncbi:MAG: hypothetical protein ACO2PN_14780 [Pyrobaculum sp.]
MVPFFSSWVVPTAAALAIALFLYIPHKTGRLLWWFGTTWASRGRWRGF